ncbi:hypothetical protein R3P38DRAFT_3215454 [Favolaschia claudopus]|uniref:Uncharacterized protein n=1 Tax=Favolaschia claudopus TaxID=2862362 RepID=A0AAW0A7W5_9AGAR
MHTTLPLLGSSSSRLVSSLPSSSSCSRPPLSSPRNHRIPAHRIPAEPRLSCPVAFSTRLPHSPPPQVHLAPQAADGHKEHRQQQRKLSRLIPATAGEREKKTNDTLAGCDDGKETESIDPDAAFKGEEGPLSSCAGADGAKGEERSVAPTFPIRWREKVDQLHAPVLQVLKKKKRDS